MTADERIAQIQLKIARAKVHVAELDERLKAFHATTPYAIGTRRDPETRRMIYYVSRVAPTPIDIALATGDALQCMRTALDHLVYQLVLAGGGAPTTRTSYPIADTLRRYKVKRSDCLHGVRDKAKAAIDATKPYADFDGNRVLWRLNQLNNIDKHRILLTVGSAYSGLDIGRYIVQSFGPQAEIDFPNMNLVLRPADRLFPLKVNDELFSDMPDAEPSEKIKFTLDVAINERGVVEGDPLFTTVTEILNTVESLIADFRKHLE